MSKRKLPSHKMTHVETAVCTRTKPTGFIRAAQSIDAAQQRFPYFIYLFVYKQPMMAGQDLKRSLATQRLTKIGTGIHTHTKDYTQKTRYGEVELKEWMLWQKQTLLLKEA